MVPGTWSHDVTRCHYRGHTGPDVPHLPGGRAAEETRGNSEFLERKATGGLHRMST
jgi:hypothetical protein